MKHMKKLIVAVLAAVTAMALCVPALAFGAEIEVKGVVDGENYTAYKILNYTDNGKTGNERAVSYYLTAAEYTQLGSALETAGFAFTASSDGTQYFVNNAETIDVAAAAASLASASLGDALGKYEATGASGSATFTNLATGYYFVTTTTGSICALHEDSEIATAVEKNTVPTVDKKQGVNNQEYADKTLDMNIGDTVYYQTEITNGKGTNKDIVLTDVMTAGLTLDQNSIAVTKGGEAVDASNYEVTDKSAQGFTLTLKAAYVKTLGEGDVVAVKYEATINTSAVVDNATANNNKVTLTYSNQTMEDTVYVETYDINLKKTDGTTALAGAKFNIYTVETGGTPLTFASDDTGYYYSATGDAEIDADDGTGVNIRGLAPGTYYFEETDEPDGYNKLPDRKSVTITSGATAAAELTVVNQKGAVLPSTGGIGTTIFYVIGGILIAVAAIFLITRKRVANARKEDEEI